MTFPDPKWLEILKASGWQTGAIALACGLFLFLARAGWLPPLTPWMVQLGAFVMLLCGFLAVASTIAAFLEAPAFQYLIGQRFEQRRERRAARNYIPFMTEQERKIIAYLLAKNQKMFTVEVGGGYAATLIARGIVTRADHDRQMATVSNIPVAVPDHIWDVLARNKEKFPYTPPPEGQTEAHPWRVPWMAPQP